MLDVKEVLGPANAVMDTVPSDDEFVAAVIRVHEGLQANLRGLMHGERWMAHPGDLDGTAVIQVYCAAHGVEP